MAMTIDELHAVMYYSCCCTGYPRRRVALSMLAVTGRHGSLGTGSVAYIPSQGSLCSYVMAELGGRVLADING